MRPVTRGDAPPGVTKYEEMRLELIARLGYYCSYCEYPVEHIPHAEHIVPKDRYPAFRDRWDNLLVSCSYCNGKKGKTTPAPEKVDDHLWPHRDNTALAFDYANVIPIVAPALTGGVRDKAARLRGLVRLAVGDDERATKRAEVFRLAEDYFSRLRSTPDPALAREAIVDLAVSKGFFSVWMHVFASDALVRQALIHAFNGTARDCFDPVTTSPVPRPGGRV
jgi:hypothetical protein